MTHRGLSGHAAACLVTVLVLLGTNQAMAGACGHDYCWGAVAAGPGGYAGRSSGLRTAPEAADRAAAACGPNCDRAEVFSNGCGAVVQAPDGRRIAGFGLDRLQAVEDARSSCPRPKKQCIVRVWACSH